MKLLATIIVIIVGMDSVLATNCGYLPKDHVVCKAEEILDEGKTGCEEIRGNVRVTDLSFPDDVQKRFHSVRLIRGRIEIQGVSNMEELHAFKDVWDIEINDPIYSDSAGPKVSGFIVRGCPDLKKIHLSSLCSFTATHDTGFSIKGNGNYTMGKKQWDFLRSRVGSRNMMKDIDRAPNPKQKKDNEMAKEISYGISVILGLITIAIVGSLVHFYTLTNRSTEQMEYFENLLNGTGEDSRDNGYNRIRVRAPKIKSERDVLFEE